MQRRPVYLNLFKITLPATAWVSVLHRASGVLMFLAIPASIYLLGLSLRDSSGYNQVLSILSHPISLLVMLSMLWALIHHLLAGIRFLLIDIDIGIEKESSRRSAWWVVIAALILTLMIAGVLI
ncbi:succinate dehydrogenase, cytochrome b556 subunit [Solemya pervernicosa gill symbiont]|uniref:Succinate dehydrogenase cytochrome b556 subunit n=2 Tax=Gammaproteobacteria incertae sedis TaxID=118884 RepID=A0A1T2LA89_9GAMM|nr:succinate dehydrogenase, cytochrome b556 subunit [Candidatus Reidiella endopervernicosa]OOZ42015.1 succinate dehydrogenase, cytochrome b556 subunit [Solemya pervernicosa gill symbiont]QKQ27044.1 succinate dehydrogenase, cytochrome b556 subunit [Candidatus Reidiella endopervernicosa]